MHAARKGQAQVTASDFEWAKDRVMLGSERRSAVITTEDKRLCVTRTCRHSVCLPADNPCLVDRTAFHEAGHALVALMTEGSTPLHSVTCLPRGQSLGLTHFLPGESACEVSDTAIRSPLTRRRALPRRNGRDESHVYAAAG